MGLGCELDEITTFPLCGPKLLKFWGTEKGEAGLKELERKGSVVVQENLVAIGVLILLRITDRLEKITFKITGSPFFPLVKVFSSKVNKRLF